MTFPSFLFPVGSYFSHYNGPVPNRSSWEEERCVLVQLQGMHSWTVGKVCQQEAAYLHHNGGPGVLEAPFSFHLLFWVWDSSQEAAAAHIQSRTHLFCFIKLTIRVTSYILVWNSMCLRREYSLLSTINLSLYHTLSCNFSICSLFICIYVFRMYLFI